MTTERITIDELRSETPACTRVLGLDPATQCGFAHSDGLRGTFTLTAKGDKQPGDKLQRFARWLRTVLKRHPTDLIAAEDASFGSRNRRTQAFHNEIRGSIKSVAAEFNIPVKLFQPTTIKKFATGSGRAQKPQMMAACKRIWGIAPRDDNEADAIAIMELAKRPDCWPRKQKKERPPKSAKKAKEKGWLFT